MKLVADESVDHEIVIRLRLDGYNVLSISEFYPGVPDDVVIDIASREGAILLTSDKDFGELVFRMYRTCKGVLLIRLAGLSQNSKSELIAKAFSSHSEKMIDTFTVITPSTLRTKKFPTN